MSSVKVKLGAAAPGYGTLEEDANTVHDHHDSGGVLETGKEPEMAVSFHDVEYVVSTNCGRKFKTVLDGVR